ncbi:MAG: prepilin-type N-terminal cleavage/methylation domain-containing protein [Gemmatimonadetes bacterium]|nr:prepilin-type N-terminal cleavage/methylation domain-containing protein [Gemmatimonadota bacterium]
MRGFSLIEVIIALVILEVGLLGATGVVWIGAITMGRAWAIEAGVASVEGVADSLSLGALPGAGGRAVDHGALTWEVAENGGFVVRFTTERGDSLSVHGMAPVVTGG